VALEDRVRAAHRFDPARFLPFVVEGAVLGYVRRDYAAELRAYPDVLAFDDNAVALRAQFDTYTARSEAMAGVAVSLASRGLLSKWRDERYDIGLGDARPACFSLERAAVRFFGFTARAVHLNGLVHGRVKTGMWIARRSADKAIDPGMLDNLMAGGVACGYSIEQTLVKEAWEEAGIPTALVAGLARPAGILRVCREVPDGLHAEALHAYDLVLPDAFTPVNQDGEVAGFRLLALEEVARELDGDAAYTIDAALVALDCLRRHLPGFGSRLSSRD